MKHRTAPWIEIISVRLYRLSSQAEVLSLMESIDPGFEQLSGVSLYRDDRLETDWSIHLRPVDGTAEPGKTLLGMRVAEVLSEFGMVNHSIWRLMDRKEGVTA